MRHSREVGNVTVGATKDVGGKVTWGAAVVRQSPALEKCKVFIRLCGKGLAVPHSRDHENLLIRLHAQSLPPHLPPRPHLAAPPAYKCHEGFGVVNLAWIRSVAPRGRSARGTSDSRYAAAESPRGSRGPP